MKSNPFVLIDTDVFSILKVGRKQDERIREWKQVVYGKVLLISFQTKAEVLSGAASLQYGEKRLEQLNEHLSMMAVVYPDDEVINAYAHLTADAKRVGHAIAQPDQTADRWIAATAIAKDLPLLTGNRKHFLDAPKLTLL